MRKLTVAQERVTLKLRPEDPPEVEAHLSAFAKAISEKIRQAPFLTMRGKFRGPNGIGLCSRTGNGKYVGHMRFTVEEFGLPGLDVEWPEKDVKLEEEDATEGGEK